MVDFLVIGAEKGGTTALHRYLSAHPQIEMPACKELAFFSDDVAHARGPGYYRSHFRHLDNPTILCGEASPQYFYSPRAAERIAGAYPRVKLLLALRDPVDRAFSHYRMSQRRGLETRSFSQVCHDFLQGRPEAGPDQAYFGHGAYGALFAAYAARFPLSQFHFLLSEDLRNDRDRTVRDILRFLGIEGQISPKVLAQDHHRSGHQRFPALARGLEQGRRLPRPVKDRLRHILGPARLRTLLHRIETEWNLSPTPAPDPGLPPDLRRGLAAHFARDAAEFRRLGGRALPWGKDMAVSLA